MELLKIINARIALMGVTDGQIAEALGWSPQRWSGAKASRSPSLRTIKLLAGVVGLTPSQLLGDADAAAGAPVPEGLDHVRNLCAEVEEVEG